MTTSSFVNLQRGTSRGRPERAADVGECCPLHLLIGQARNSWSVSTTLLWSVGEWTFRRGPMLGGPSPRTIARPDDRGDRMHPRRRSAHRAVGCHVPRHGVPLVHRGEGARHVGPRLTLHTAWSPRGGATFSQILSWRGQHGRPRSDSPISVRSSRNAKRRGQRSTSRRTHPR